MPGPYEILNARVQQKVDTLAGWLAVEAELGVILPGEQAFEINESGVLTNFKIGDGTKLYSELPYFITYYTNVVNQKILKYIDGNTDIAITSLFRDFSCIYDIILINNSGATLDFKVGTTDGGNELMEISVPPGVLHQNLRKVFSANTDVYLSGLAGNNYSLFLVYFQYDENPATPPAGDPAAFQFPRCFKGMFEPLTDTDLDDNWDFTTGLGKPGTPWANCAISGTNGTEDMADFYASGWKVGDSLFPATTFGSTGGSIVIAKANLPSLRPKIYGQEGGKPGFGGGRTGRWVTQDGSGNNAGDGAYTQEEMGGTSVPIDIRPKTKKVLYFVAIS